MTSQNAVVLIYGIGVPIKVIAPSAVKEHEECMYAIIDAKIRAEYDSGVGKLCDMLFIESSINKVSPEKLKKILTHFSKCEDRIKKIEEICSKEMVKLI